MVCLILLLARLNIGQGDRHHCVRYSCSIHPPSSTVIACHTSPWGASNLSDSGPLAKMSANPTMSVAGHLRDGEEPAEQRPDEDQGRGSLRGTSLTLPVIRVAQLQKRPASRRPRGAGSRRRRRARPPEISNRVTHRRSGGRGANRPRQKPERWAKERSEIHRLRHEIPLAPPRRPPKRPQHPTRPPPCGRRPPVWNGLGAQIYDDHKLLDTMSHPLQILVYLSMVKWLPHSGVSS